MKKYTILQILIFIAVLSEAQSTLYYWSNNKKITVRADSSLSYCWTLTNNNYFSQRSLLKDE